MADSVEEQTGWPAKLCLSVWHQQEIVDHMQDQPCMEEAGTYVREDLVTAKDEEITRLREVLHSVRRVACEMQLSAARRDLFAAVNPALGLRTDRAQK